MHATTVSIPSRLCSPPGVAQKRATRPQKKWSKLKLRTQHKSKMCGFPHNVRSFAHQTCTKERFHDEVESLLCTKVSGTQDRCQRFPERVQTVLEEVYILLADPSPRRKQLFRFETEAQLVCMAMNTLRRFQQRAKSCLRSSV